MSHVLRDHLRKTVALAMMFFLRFVLFFGLSFLVVELIVTWKLLVGLTVFRHYVIRWQMAHHRLFPFRVQAFLGDATNRILAARGGIQLHPSPPGRLFCRYGSTPRQG